MPSQNNSGQQYDKQHSVTVVATVAVAANRILAYDGGYASAAGGAKDAQGLTETAGDIGEAISVNTGYSGLVEANEAIAQFAYLKPATDGSGRAAVGTLTDHCGRALGAAGALGQLVEMQIVTHRHA